MYPSRADIAIEGLARSVLEIRNTPSRVPDGGEACQRCTPGGSAIVREAVKAMCTPSTTYISHQALFAWPRRKVVLGVTEANWIGPNHTCRTAELAVNGTADARPCAEIFRVHREGGRAARYENEDTYLSEG